jgi:cytidylate kinase
MKRISVAIDGPSGAGKSTIARAVAKEFGFIYVDTGAMYRAVGLYIMRKGVSSKDASSIINLLNEIRIELCYLDGIQRIRLNGEDVSSLIRTPEVSIYASDVSAIGEVREFLLGLQRDMAKQNSVVMDGRDIGTVVLPNADVKIFLTASAEERARRRYEELLARGDKSPFEAVLRDMRYRDLNDSTRAQAPLKKARDAIEIDTTGNSLEESIRIITDLVKDRISYGL